MKPLKSITLISAIFAFSVCAFAQKETTANLNSVEVEKETKDNGHSKYSSGNYDAAIVDYTAYISKNPKSPDGYLYRAAAYQQKGEYQLALSDFSKAIELKPRAMAYYVGRSHVYSQTSDYKKAADDLTIAINMSNKDAQLYIYRAMALYADNKKSEACQDLKTAKKLGYDTTQLEADMCKIN